LNALFGVESLVSILSVFKFSGNEFIFFVVKHDYLEGKFTFEVLDFIDDTSVMILDSLEY
jgi:hypothetical protein